MKYSELSKRIGVAVLGIPLIIAATLAGKIFFLILVDIILVLALWEFYNLTEKKGVSPLKLLGIISVLVLSLEFYLHEGQWTGWLIFLFVFFVLSIQLFKGISDSIINAATTIFGVLYISLFSSFILIREIPKCFNCPYSVGGWLVLLIFTTIWICDTGAYFFGRKYGKHSLYKSVSPNKTWEGAIGGFITGVVAAIGFRFLFVPSISIVDAIMIGTIVGTIGQLSDLIESMYKRDAGVKDTSNILPGHGGILDRFDSPLLVGPVIYLYFILKDFNG